MASGADADESTGETSAHWKGDPRMDASDLNRGSLVEASSPWQDLHARLESSLQRLRDSQVGSRSSLHRPLREPLLGPATTGDRSSDQLDSRHARIAEAGQGRLSTGSAASFLSSPEVQHYSTAVNSARDSMQSCSSARTAASEPQGNVQPAAELSARSSSPHSFASNQSEGLNAALFPTFGGDSSNSPKFEPGRPPSPGRTLCCRRRYDGGVADLESKRPSALSLAAMRRLPLTKEPDGTTIEVSTPLPDPVKVEPGPAVGSGQAAEEVTLVEQAETVAQTTSNVDQVTPVSPPLEKTRGFGQWLQSLGWRRNGGSAAEDGGLQEGAQAVEGGLDIVQFAAPYFVADERAQTACIEVIRLGSLQGHCSVDYYTCEGQVQATPRYAATAGKVNFLEGETHKRVQAALIPDGHWTTTPELQVRLDNPQNCELDDSLCQCGVKVMDAVGNTFPSARYRDRVTHRGRGGIEDIKSMALMWRYMWLNFMAAPGVRWRTLLFLALDQLKSIYRYLRLVIGVYIVDTLLNTAEEQAKDALLTHQGPADGRVWTAAVVGAAYFTPLLMLLLWECSKVRLRLPGLCKMFLQANLMRRYLNYDTSSLQMVTPDGLEAAILSDADMVSRAYVAAVAATQHLGAFMAIFCFIMVENTATIGWFLVLASLLLATSAVGIAKRRRHYRKHGKVRTSVRSTCTASSLIRSYGQCARACQAFQETCQDDAIAATQRDQEVQFVQRVAHFLAALFTTLYGVLNLTAALTDALSLGAFLLTLVAFHEACEALSNLVEQLCTITAATEPLKDLTWLLNLPTDLQAQQKVAAVLSDYTQNARMAASETLGKLGSSEPLEDQVAIQLRGIAIASPWTEGSFLCRDVTTSVPQGKLVAVVGQSFASASMLLRIIGRDVAPSSGDVLVPAHLRVLHLSSEPVYFDASCWENITYGRPEADPDFVLSLLRRMGMPSAVERVEEDLRQRQSASNKSARSFKAECKATACSAEGIAEMKAMHESEQVKLQLARAFVMNPEVLVLHGQFAKFGEGFCQTVFEVLQEFVRHRGVALSEKSKDRRRPRTCFFSPEMVAQAEASDIVWYLRSSTASVQSFQGSEFAADTSLRMELLKAC